MHNNEIIKLFADPIFKYKLDDFENVNKDLENIFIIFMQRITKG